MGAFWMDNTKRIRDLAASFWVRPADPRRACRPVGRFLEKIDVEKIDSVLIRKTNTGADFLASVAPPMSGSADVSAGAL